MAEEKGSKTAAIIIFTVLIIFLIGYVIYTFEAFKNQWFPFGFNPNKINLPKDAIRPMGKVLEDDDSGPTDQQKNLISEVLTLNSDWYDNYSCKKNPTNPNCSIPLNNNTPVLGSD